VPLFGFGAGTSTVLIGLSLVGGPDLLLVVAIAVMGKENIEELMERSGGFLKKVLRWDAVSRTRYIVGLWVIAASWIAPLVALIWWEDSISKIGGEPGWGFWVLLGSTVVFIGAVLSMGAPLWGRIQAIVTWEATVTLPPKKTKQSRRDSSED